MSIYDMILLGQMNFFYEMLIPMLIMTRRQEKRRFFRLRLLLVAAASVGLYFMPSLEIGPFGMSYLIDAALVFLVGLFCLRLPLLDILFYTVASFAVQHIMWDVLFIAYDFIGDAITRPLAIALYASMYIVMYLLFYLFFPVSGEKGGDVKDRRFELAVSALTLVFTYVLSSLVAYYPGWTILYRCYALLCCSFVLCLQFGIFERRKLKERNRELEQDKVVLEELLSRERRQYAFTKDTIDLINIKCHDLKHQISALRSMSGEEREKSIGEVEKAVMIYGNIAKTGNETLDTILTEKSLLCEKYKIRFTYMIDGESLSFMDPVDLSSLFGNAVENAIESVMKEEDAERRIIKINVSVKRKFLTLHFENYCSQTLRFRDGLPVTVKNDKNYHGYGTKSIRYVVEKYGGTLLMGQSGRLFTLDIIFPAARESALTA